MKVLVVPDSFKGSLTSNQICQIVEYSIKKINNEASVQKIPMADGGEGTVDALVLNTGGEFKNCKVTGPMGNMVNATYGILGDKETAVIEMASASGLTLVPEGERNPLFASTYGTGELIKDALDQGCSKIIMGIGGSATNDGGVGMLKSLGYEFLDKDGQEISTGARGLLEIHDINFDKVDDRLRNTHFLVACDVDNPLYGPKGATFTYGPQKGATEEMLPLLEKGLKNFDKIIIKKLGKHVADMPGSGAAGGIGAGLLGFLNTTLKSGFEIISASIGLDNIICDNNFDLIITGEGQINNQTLHGKLPYGIGQLGKKYKVPVVAIVGSIGEGIEPIYSNGMTSVFSIVNQPMSLKDSINNCETLLSDTVKRIFRLIQEFK